jgi:predicted ester cyclase
VPHRKCEEFVTATTIHSAACGKPIVNGDQFVCQLSLDCTITQGPVADQHDELSHTAVYTVTNGRITKGRPVDGCGA